MGKRKAERNLTVLPQRTHTIETHSQTYETFRAAGNQQQKPRNHERRGSFSCRDERQRSTAGLQPSATDVNNKTKRRLKHETCGEEREVWQNSMTEKKNNQTTNQLLNTERIGFCRKERHPQTNLQTKSFFKTLFIYIYIFIYVSIQWLIFRPTSLHGIMYIHTIGIS